MAGGCFLHFSSFSAITVGTCWISEEPSFTFPLEKGKYPFQYSGLENSMDCIVHGVAKSRTQLSDFHFHLHSHLVARNHWWLWHFLFIDMARDIFISQARTLEWVTISYSKGFSKPVIELMSLVPPALADCFFTTILSKKPHVHYKNQLLVSMIWGLCWILSINE